MDDKMKAFIESCIYREIDGYYVFYPSKPGFLTATVLREIADYIDDKNKDWDAQVAKDLNKVYDIVSDKDCQ